MKIKLFLNKDINENANFYFNKAKKLKAKLPGVEKTIEKTKAEIKDFEEEKKEYLKERERKEKLTNIKKKEWFDNFRYTYTEEGFLFVIGKDATSNETLIKKHMENEDIVLHSLAPGSPFGLIKKSRNKIKENEIQECMEYLLCFSKQWKSGYGDSDGFYVYPEQVSKKAQSGEYIAKGSYMIYGKKNILKNINLRISLGIRKIKLKSLDEEIEIAEPFSGSQKACKKYCGNKFVNLEPGSMTYKALNKEIKKKLNISIDDLPKYIPNNCKVLKK